MRILHFPVPARHDRLGGSAVFLAALCVALASAHDYAGSWNDGSRLATVECLVDYHTLAIERSVFVAVPPQRDPGQPTPYPPDNALLMERGTADKLLIDGHYYSDKSPVPALLLAGLYQALQTTTGLIARDRPDQFCYGLTVGSSGLAYAAAVWAVYALGGLLTLPLGMRLALTASFALATVALPYTRHVNNHVFLLGVVALLLVQLAHLEHDAASWRRLLAVGTLAGLGYTIDLGAGPVLLLCLLPLIAYRCGSLRAPALVLLAALPWLGLHHAVNYAVGGTWKPANAVPEYFHWPGCPFTPDNLTGAWTHPSLWRFLLYAGDLLLGKNGFLGHNLALFLAVGGAGLLLWRRVPEWPLVLFVCAFAGGTWFLYALTSTNHAGLCCSVRWLVPATAAGYYLLALLLRDAPEYRRDFLVLSAWGLVLGALMWWKGPWMQRMVPGYWFLFAGALLSWLGVHLTRPRCPVLPDTGTDLAPHEAAARGQPREEAVAERLRAG